MNKDFCTHVWKDGFGARAPKMDGYKSALFLCCRSESSRSCEISPSDSRPTSGPTGGQAQSKKLFFLLASWRSMTKITGSDPYQNDVMVPQHWFELYHTVCHVTFSGRTLKINYHKRGCGSGILIRVDPHLFWKLSGSESALEGKAESGSALRSKFRSFIGSKWSALNTHNGGLEAQNGALECL